MEINTPLINDLLKISLGENDEEFVEINTISPNIICNYDKFDMQKYLGDKMIVRKTVAMKLVSVADKLNKMFPNYKLKIVYAFRHPEVQLGYFKRRKEEFRKLNPDDSDDLLNERTHMLVADPRVAGHPTGASVDLRITTPDGDLDMGTALAPKYYSEEDKEKIKTFTSLINETQRKNRMLLHDLMLSEGFAPFYGEWWHFSYGDREWACFYKRESSLYSAKEFSL